MRAVIISFVGFLGAGIYTHYNNLGELFHRCYVDADRLAERMAGKSLAKSTKMTVKSRQAKLRVLHTLKS